MRPCQRDPARNGRGGKGAWAPDWERAIEEMECSGVLGLDRRWAGLPGVCWAGLDQGRFGPDWAADGPASRALSLLISLFSKSDRPKIIKRRGHGEEQNYGTFLYGFMEYFHLNKNSSDKLGEFKFKLI